MKHILVHREGKLQLFRASSAGLAQTGRVSWIGLRQLGLTVLILAMCLGSAFAQVGGTGPSADFDGDGIINSVDTDDDGDGILDVVESPGCFYTAAEAAKITAVTSDIPVSSISYQRTNLIDGDFTTTSRSSFGPTAPFSMAGKEVFRVVPTIPVAIQSLNLYMNGNTGNDWLSWNGTSTLQLQGYNGTTWVNLTATPSTYGMFISGVVTITNNQPTQVFREYRLLGVNGLVGYSVISEITLTPHSSYDQQSHPKPVCTGNWDTDSDYLPNYLDITNGGPTSPSADFDGDGVINSVDQDDDNDGVLDTVESPASCYYTAAEAVKLVNVTSDFAAYNNAGGAYERAHAIDGDFTVNSRTSFANASTPMSGSVIYSVVPANPVAISSLNLFKYDGGGADYFSVNAGSTFKLQGYDGTNWVDLSLPMINQQNGQATISIPNSIFPNVAYQAYRLLGIAGSVGFGTIAEITLTATTPYNPQLHPKAGCGLDADGDFIPNHLELDSDGDGCSDANEYYTSQSADGGDGGTYGTGTPAVNSTTGRVLAAAYSGIYQYAINPAISACTAEICGDGIDNDGDTFVDSYDSDCPCSLTGTINVCPPDCEYNPNPANPFTIKKAFSTPATGVNRVHVYQTPLVGDVDADGKTDFIIASVDNLNAGYYASNINIFDGHTGLLKNKINTVINAATTEGYLYLGAENALVMGNTDKSDAQAEIYATTFSPGYSFHLTMYKADGSQVWRSADDVYAGTNYGPKTAIQSSSAMGLADFNGDGIAELYVLNKIYNAVTGALLLDGPSLFGPNSGMGRGYFNGVSVAADLTSHAGLELAAGNSVYEITITNPNGTAGNTMVEKRMPSPYVDGATGIVDMNLDGGMDVVVRTPDQVYVYDPRTMTLIASVASTGGIAAGVPFIGDVDNDGAPEIGVTRSNAIDMFEYNGTTTLVTKWSQPTSDGSGGTGITMFDFNQDGKQELLYRDETNMRIMDGSTGTNLATFPSVSSTGGEMPVVADVDDDGQANILVTSATSNPIARVDIFSTNSFPWAPARHVWNQSAYHVTNVNDDLTIPINEQSNATVFPNGVRILNNFRQQSTSYDSTGNYVFPAITIKHDFVPAATDPATGYSLANSNYYAKTCVNGVPTSVTLTIPVINTGNVPTPVNMPISIYLGDPFTSATAQLVQTITVPPALAANGGSYTAVTAINTTGFPANFKLYTVLGDPGATAPFPKDLTTYINGLNMGFCASASSVGVYGAFSCTCPVITANTTTNPLTCAGANGSIRICGLIASGTSYTITYTKNGVAQPALINQTADASGCISLTGLTAGVYSAIKVTLPSCTDGSNILGPITLTDPGPPSPPVPSVSSLTICSGDAVNINYTTTPAGQTVQWTRMPGSFSAVGNVVDFPTATGTTPVSYTYTAKITGVPGCESAAATTVVLVNPKPQITPSVCSQTICSGQTGAISFISNIPGETIHWTRTPTTPGSFSGTGNISQSLINTGPTSLTYTYTIWAEYNGSVSCPTSNTITCIIVVTPGLTVTASANSATVCVGSPLSLSANVTPAGSYTYTWTGPGYSGSGANPTVSATAAVTNSGTYTVVVTDAAGCSGTATVDVVVTDCTIPCNLTVTASASPTAVCVGGSVNLSAAITPAGSYTYAWSGSNSFTSNVQNPSIINIAPNQEGGAVVFTVTVTDATGCTAVSTVLVDVQQPFVEITSNSPQCAGNTVSLSATAGFNSYSWTGPNSFTSTQQNPTIPNATTSATGSYSVVVTNALGCTASASSSVTIAIQPSLTVTAGPSLTICSGQSTTLAVSGNNGSSVSWNNSLGQSGTGTSINFAGIRNVGALPLSVTYVIGATAGTCSDQEIVVITINPEPVLQVVPSQVIYCDIEDVKLTATVIPVTATITWNRTPLPGTGGSGVGSVTIQETLPAANYVYTFTATGTNGCSSPTQSIAVTVQP